MSAGNEYELNYWQQNKLLIGLDEAGRGPIAGPLVVAGVIFPKDYQNDLLEDSKQLTEKKRNELYPIIIKEALYHQIEIISPEVIDQFDIYHATQNAMRKIATEAPCEIILSDAMPLNINNKECISLIKGDHLSLSIAAASILAKVTRDEIMYAYDKLFPMYNFASHKGYPTKAHLLAIEQYGINDLYRKSYAPVKKIQELTLF